jgi:hypothetical protein
MVQRFLNVVALFKFKFKFYQRYIANMIGAACNYRTPQANLHAGLNFVHCKEFKPLKSSYLKLLLVSTVVQKVLSLPE